MESEVQKVSKAHNTWDAANTVMITMKLNKNTDKDLIAFLQKQQNRQGFLKELIREAMKKAGG